MTGEKSGTRIKSRRDRRIGASAAVGWAVGFGAIGTASGGALAAGALGLGAVAVGALAIGRLVVASARVRRLEIDELTIRRLRVEATDGVAAATGAISLAGHLPLAPGPTAVGDVFYFVADLEAAVAWYAARLARQPLARGGALAAFDIAGTRLTVPAIDDLDSPGPAGAVAYWTVPDVDAFPAEWIAHGAKGHCGPKTVSTGERLCQLIDPFGNVFAIRQDIAPTA